MKPLTPDHTWFSYYFGIEKPQYELPFVDFPLNKDVPLYIDPYAITKDPSDLGATCHNAIVSYFQTLLYAVREGDTHRVRYLIHDRLVEPKEIHLGVSRRARQGAGLGPTQEGQVLNALTQSEAFKAGLIQSIQELELHIPGIGPDKISDLVANIIKGSLAGYTEQMCSEQGIATRPCAVNAYWNSERLEWDAGYYNLPIRGVDAYILVPKQFIRRERDLLNHREFYDHYVLEVLQREMITANDSLVRTLQSGERRITKKDLREDSRFPFTKDFISHFIQEHPETIERYRHDLMERFRPADPAESSGKASEDDPRIRALLESLSAIPTGAKSASTYHTTVFELVEFTFDWGLQNFEKEYKMDQGRGRIDVMCDNYANGGLFKDLRTELNAGSVPMECKNYSTDLGNNEFNQLNDRLGSESSRLGFLFCRSVGDPEAMSRHVTDRWLRHKNCMLLFDDERLTRLVELRLQRNFQQIEAELRRMIRRVKFGNPS